MVSHMKRGCSGRSCLELFEIIVQAEKIEKVRKDELKRSEEGPPVSSFLVGKGDGLASFTMCARDMEGGMSN